MILPKRFQRGDDDERSHGEHKEGIDEHTDHGDNALVVRLIDIGKGMCVRCGTHTGFVGEKSALDALADCGF